MNNWKVIFATVVIFGTGVFTGGLLVDYIHHPHFNRMSRKLVAVAHASGTNQVANQATNQTAHTPDNAKLHPPEILSKQFLQRLDGDLHLTPEQHNAVQKIIGDGQSLMRKVIQDTRLEIREALTPEQCKNFDELMKRPFHKPLFNTNAPSTAGSFSNMAAQIISFEAQRTNPLPPSPPAFTNAP